MIVALLAAVFVVSAVLIYRYTISSSVPVSKSITTTSVPMSNVTSQELNAINVLAMLDSNYTHLRGLDYILNYNYSYNTIYCAGIEYVKAYFQSSMLLNSPPYNFSEFNRSIPLLTYIGVENLTNPKSYYEWLLNGGGVCINNFNLILQNSTYEELNYTYDGLPVRLYYLYNFTNNGLNLTYNQYTSKKPDLYWVFAISVYKNLKIGYGEWGFEGFQNISRVIDEENTLIREVAG